jgi:hypothetical protein
MRALQFRLSRKHVLVGACPFGTPRLTPAWLAPKTAKGWEADEPAGSPDDDVESLAFSIQNAPPPQAS